MLACLALAAVALATVPAAIGDRAAVVVQGSMAPAVPAGAVVVLERVPMRSLRVGDVASVVPPGRIASVTHRVVAIEGEGDQAVLVTQGDANPVPDAWRIPVVGEGWRVALVVPAVGYAVTFLSFGPLRWLLLLAAAGLAASVLRARRPHHNVSCWRQLLGRDWLTDREDPVSGGPPSIGDTPVHDVGQAPLVDNGSTAKGGSP